MARDIYTADMGNPPSPDEGAPPKKPQKRATKPVVKDVYTADMGNPPSPDEGPTMDVSPQKQPAKKPAAYAKGGKVGSASKRADGIATKGKTKGRMI